MADLLRALPFVLKNEGGKCDLKGDTGGRTNCGISTPELLDFNRRHPELHFSNDPWALSPGDIGTIYRLDYWRYDGLKDQAVATKIFDMDVNDGLPSGVRLAQRAAVICGQQIATDGCYGPATEAALNACDPSRLMDALIQVSVAHYQSVAAEHPNDQPFLKDWLYRAGLVPNA